MFMRGIVRNVHCCCGIDFYFWGVEEHWKDEGGLQAHILDVALNGKKEPK